MFFEAGVLVFLASVIFSLIFIKLDKSHVYALILGCLGLAFFAAFSFQTLLSGDSSSFTLTTFPIQFSFFVDNLSAFLVLLISIVSICVSIYCLGYADHFESQGKKNIFAFLTLAFILSMILTVCSKTFPAFIFFWEVMSLSSFFLVMLDYKKDDAKKAGVFYFIMTQLSTVFLLLGIGASFVLTGNFEIAAVKTLSPLVGALLFLPFFIGFAIKAGVVPFHKWLPYAHPASPSPISALMSGVMLKVAIYGMLRLLFYLNINSLWIGLLVFILGIISAFLGIVYALKESDLKRLLAYSSIENVGIILAGIGLYLIFNSLGFASLGVIAIAGTFFHIVGHALFKSLLFLTAGSVLYATGTKNIEELGGLVKSMPFTSVLFLVGAIAIAGIPPLNGFVSEFLIFQALFHEGIRLPPLLEILLFACLSIFALTSALAATCFAKAFGAVFLSHPRSSGALAAKEVHNSMLIAPAILAGLCLLIGVFSYQIISYINAATGVDVAFPDMLIVSGLIVGIGCLVFVVMRVFFPSKTRLSETWGCGIITQTARMEYTGAGFSQPVLRMFGAIYGSKVQSVRTFHDDKNVIFKGGEGKISTVKFFEQSIYLPISNFFAAIGKFVNGINLSYGFNRYLVYSAVSIVLLVVVVGLIL